MTPEELLNPRYEVVALYPYSPFEVKDILHVDGGGELFGKATGYVPSKVKVMEEEAKELPHLFRKLAWHERRKLDDIKQVQYLKYFSLSRQTYVIVKVGDWRIGDYFSNKNVVLFNSLSSLQEGYYELVTEDDFKKYEILHP